MSISLAIKLVLIIIIGILIGCYELEEYRQTIWGDNSSKVWCVIKYTCMFLLKILVASLLIIAAGGNDNPSEEDAVEMREPAW